MEFSEIANRSPFSFLLPAPLLPAPLNCAAPPAVAVEGHPRATYCLLDSTRRTEAPRRPLPSRWCFLRSATRPRPPAGCHLAAVVARAARSPGALSRACNSTTRTPSTSSPHPFARSLPRLPKSAPPSTRNPGELDAATGLPLQPSSARTDPLSSSTVGPRSSPTHPPRPISTGAPSPS